MTIGILISLIFFLDITLIREDDRPKSLRVRRRTGGYFDLIATTGFNLAAITAGMIPASTPTTKQMLIATIRLAVEIYTGKLNAPDKIFVRPNTNNNPISPPIRQRNAASSRNSISMIWLLAPIDFFKPIWLGRSFTLTKLRLAKPNQTTIT